MANTLSPKAKIIRQAITARPAVGNTALASTLNDAVERLDDKLTFTAQDVANQKTALKKPGAMKPVLELSAAPAAEPAVEGAEAKPAGKKRGRKPGSKNRPRAVARAATSPASAPAAAVSPVDLIDRVFALADDCGGMAALKRLVDRLAGA